jgi:hypothetical protein
VRLQSAASACPSLCRSYGASGEEIISIGADENLATFSDAGMTNSSTRCGGWRPKSAKARSRGKLGTGGAAGAMGI